MSQPQMPQTQIAPVARPLEEEAPTIDVGGPWVVILYNCDCHTFDQVIEQLQKAIACSLKKAWQIAMEAHHRGRAIAYTGEEGECERVASILRAIRLQVETDLY